METKKRPNVDLERFKGLFVQIGFVLALGFILLAFEWTTSDNDVEGFGNYGEFVIEEEFVMATKQEEPKPPEPKKLQQIAEVLNIMDNDIEIDDEMESLDLEADEDMQIEILDQ